jgi:hypothetical protein
MAPTEDSIDRYLPSDAFHTCPTEIAEQLIRMDFVVLDEFGYLPFVRACGQVGPHITATSS